MSEIDRWQFRAERGRKWSYEQRVAVGVSFDHVPMGTTMDGDRRRPWSFWKLTLHLLIWKLSATLYVWTD